MTSFQPEDWRAELAKAFDPKESRPSIEVDFIGPDGQPVGESLVFLRGGGQNGRPRMPQLVDDLS